MSSSEREKWMRKFHVLDKTYGRVIFLPHAGGSASYYRDLCMALSSSNIECIAIQYPGRQDRFKEEMIESIEEYADIITEILVGLDDKPTILFGHSMGALIAYNMLARHETELSFVDLFVASAHHPPKSSEPYIKGDSASDENVIAHLKKLGGFDDRLLSDPTIIEVILPAVENDLQAVSKFHMKSIVKLQVPIVSVIGMHDPTTDIESTSEWAKLTAKEFRIVQLSGGHFYFANEHTKLINIILQLLIKAGGEH
ncbi:thioesterase II family protein [Paenibacillus wynnii]|uniref:thioesterase II family protein n=1 Tax=Paenibacillus wynnii TaxID=268407 RepID=UPI00278E2D14|nr:alpha/beta fold hydrolase [Paenibacillus wynnii]MDQ0195350.1 surfactin synthase thioesterase subunit [Paenibacillus wynnii]